MKSGTKFGVAGFFAVIAVASLTVAFHEFAPMIIIFGGLFSGIALSIFGDTE